MNRSVLTLLSVPTWWWAALQGAELPSAARRARRSALVRGSSWRAGGGGRGPPPEFSSSTEGGGRGGGEGRREAARGWQPLRPPRGAAVRGDPGVRAWTQFRKCDNFIFCLGSLRAVAGIVLQVVLVEVVMSQEGRSAGKILGSPVHLGRRQTAAPQSWPEGLNLPRTEARPPAHPAT